MGEYTTVLQSHESKAPGSAGGRAGEVGGRGERREKEKKKKEKEKEMEQDKVKKTEPHTRGEEKPTGHSKNTGEPKS